MKRVKFIYIENRDSLTTDLILDNETVVEVDVINLFENMLENNGDVELLNMFYELIKKLND
jgi:hypothetical protein